MDGTEFDPIWKPHECNLVCKHFRRWETMEKHSAKVLLMRLWIYPAKVMYKKGYFTIREEGATISWLWWKDVDWK